MNIKKLNIFDHGIEILEGILSDEVMQLVVNEIENSDITMPKHGVRNAEKKFNSIRRVAEDETLRKKAKEILGKEPQIVRVIFFDKTPEKNWLVTWHQDKTVALNRKEEIEGWETWSLKDGVHHVQPPVEVLNEMVTFRLHLDDADEQNGCLKIIPCSHQSGVLNQTTIDEVVSREKPVFCTVSAGDAVVMRPHILHSSSKSLSPKHRRVIHIEFSSYALPDKVDWAS